MSAVALLLPDFALILLGWGLRRYLALGDAFWSGLERLVYFVLFPALLFNALLATRIVFSDAGPLIGAGLIAMACGMLFALLARPLFGQADIIFASHFQCAFRFNSYIGLAAAGTLSGASGIAAMGILLGSMVPFANLAAVAMLARHHRRGMWYEIVRNPLVLATLAGLACNFAGMPYPDMARHFLGRLAEASITLGLLAVGAALRLPGHGNGGAPTAYLTAVKLIVVPACAWVLGRAFGLAPLYFDMLVVYAALPCATSAYILAVRMGGDGPGTARLISISTILAMLSMSGWISALA